MDKIRRRHVTSRRRTVNTCETCRRRKTKCDQQRPQCGPCQSLSRHCTYIDAPKQRGSGPHRDPDPENGNVEQAPAHSTGAMLSTGPQPRYAARNMWLPDVLGTANGAGQSHHSSSPLLTSEVANSTSTPLSQQYAVQDWVNSIPESEFTRLTQWFSEHCYIFVSVITPRELEALLPLCLSKTGHVDHEDLTLLAAVCYVATSSILTWSSSVKVSKSPAQWKVVVDNMLKERQGPPSLQQLRTLGLLAVSTVGEGRQSVDVPTVLPVAMLVRNAQLMGLHRDPSKVLDIDSEKCEERRRLFWIVYDFDVCFAMAHGLPPLISHSGYDVAELTEYKDSHPAVRFLKYKCKAGELFARIMDEIYGVKPLALSTFDELADAAAAFRVEVDTLREYEGVGGKFVYRSLCMIGQRLDFTMHQLYLRNVRQSNSRQLALSTSLAFIEDYMSITNDFIFAPLRWVLDHFNVFHPCAIVLQDLMLYPNSAEADNSRVVLDSCFSLLGDAGDEKWQMLERLRLRAEMLNGWIKPTHPTDDILDDVSTLVDWDALFELEPFTTSIFG